MKVGTRVLVPSGAGLYKLAIIKSIAGETATLQMDNAQFQSASVSRLIPIIFFDKFIPGTVDKKWFAEHQKLIKPADYDIRNFFLMKKAQLCTVPLLTCMFYWCNEYVFGKELTLPKLGTNTKARGRSGVYIDKENYLAVSAKTNVTCKEIWSTLCHEVVHVYQFQVDWRKNGTFDPRSGAHGKSFFKWRGPLKEIADVDLEKLHDLSAIEVDEAEETPTAKKSTYVFISSVPGAVKTNYYGCKNDNLENIEEARKVFRSKVGMTAKYYTRTLSNAPLLNLLVNCKNAGGMGCLKVNGYNFSPLPQSVFDNILKIAKPIS